VVKLRPYRIPKARRDAVRSKVKAMLAGLLAKPRECKLGLQEAEYLGYSIGRGFVKPQVKKVEAIRPLTKKQVRTFVGLTSYYQRFIPPSLTSPLIDLTRSRMPDKSRGPRRHRKPSKT